MLIKKTITVLSMFLILHSCFIGAGTVGKITAYDFNFSISELEQKIDSIVSISPDIEKQDSDEYYTLLVEKYGSNKSNGGDDNFRRSYAKYSYITIVDKDEKFIFSYTIIGSKNSSEIILVSGDIYGRGIGIADNLDRKLKKILSNTFKDKFIKQLEK